VAGIKARRTGKIHLSEKVKNGVQILREAHEYLEQQIVEGEIKDDFADLLGQCQDFAVSLGTEIENNAVNPEKTVNKLEKYCEKIYEVYQRIVSDTDQITMEELSDYISSLREIEDVLTGMSGEIDDKKEIVFITYRPKTWNTLHPLWDVIKKRDDVIVTVIAVPYYYKDFDGNTIKEDMQFNPDDYPDEVETTPYEQYDLELHHPDIIVTQCPYDAYSDAFTIHPYFYTENLYRFTDQLVMIPEFTLREIIDEDERSRIMLRDYVQTPGMVFADRVYVQSEGMRKVYIELLEQFMVDELSDEVAYNLSGTDEADIDKIKKVIDWGEKIRGSGAPVYDWQNKRRNLYKSIEREVCYDDSGEIVTPGGYDHILEVPEEWIKKSSRQDGSRKKVMLCCVSGSVLLTYGMTCLTHMMRAVEIMLEYKEDLVVIYTPDPNVKKILSGNDEVTLDKYISWVEGLVERSDIIVDMSGDAKRVSLFADAYYGDGCVAMNECRMQHKPTLTESPKASLEATKRYEPQTWNADMTVEDEGKWMLRNYIDEVLGYELPSDPTGNSERIVEDLFR
ncbi:MAG: hypothetical protein II915_03665, partial [Eubacterium sp.]|nr:hypothetical protein [Eubacterium sp.]